MLIDRSELHLFFVIGTPDHHAMRPLFTSWLGRIALERRALQDVQPGVAEPPLHGNMAEEAQDRAGATQDLAGSSRNSMEEVKDFARSSVAKVAMLSSKPGMFTNGTQMRSNGAPTSGNNAAMFSDQGAMFAEVHERSATSSRMSGNNGPRPGKNAAKSCEASEHTTASSSVVRRGKGRWSMVRAFLLRVGAVLYGMTRAHWWFGMSEDDYASLEPVWWDDLFLLEYGFMNRTADVLAIRVEAALNTEAEQRFERLLMYRCTPVQLLNGALWAVLIVFAFRLLGLRAVQARHVLAGALALPGRAAGRALYARPPPTGTPFWSVG